MKTIRFLIRLVGGVLILVLGVVVDLLMMLVSGHDRELVERVYPQGGRLPRLR